MKDSRKQFIKDGHKAACSEWKTKIEKEFPKLFKETELVVGKWYKYGVCGSLMPWNNGESTYGFFDGEYDSSWCFGRDVSTAIPATDKEVEDALIKEAKKRGFKEGVKFYNISVHIEDDFNDTCTCCNDYRYHSDDPSLCLGDGSIFYKGKWATIIQTITKAEAEKELGKTIV